MELGWHPVAGSAGKWFAEQTRLGKAITEEIHKCPDPTQHWAVLVGEYVHELWMGMFVAQRVRMLRNRGLRLSPSDEHLDIIYINEKLNRDEWHTFEIGKTRFNDEALRQAGESLKHHSQPFKGLSSLTMSVRQFPGEMCIFNMREKRAAYNLINNNCQNFALNLLDQIRVGKHRDFATSFIVYQRAIGKGAIKDLFEQVEHHPDEKQGVEDEKPALQHQDTLQAAQQVMDDNTTKLDNHHSFFQ